MTPDVTFEKISASLGSLLLLWAAIERAARDEVARLHGGCLPKSAHGIAAVLNTWEAAVISVRPEAPFRALLAAKLRAELQLPLKIRNGVCHGLVGISSAYDGRPAALTWEINDAKCSITWEELQSMFSWLSKVHLAISMITNSSTEQAGSRMVDNSENRKWWLEEFGLGSYDANLSAE
jgi:hypothetical protein